MMEISFGTAKITQACCMLPNKKCPFSQNIEGDIITKMQINLIRIADET